MGAMFPINKTFNEPGLCGSTDLPQLQSYCPVDWMRRLINHGAPLRIGSRCPQSDTQHSSLPRNSTVRDANILCAASSSLRCRFSYIRCFAVVNGWRRRRSRKAYSVVRSPAESWGSSGGRCTFPQVASGIVMRARGLEKLSSFVHLRSLLI